MAEKTLSVDIVTPEKSIYSGTEVTLVSATATLGRVGILPGHMPFVSSLERGEMHLLEKDGRGIRMMLGPGFIQVKDNNVILLTQEASTLSTAEGP